MAGVAGTSMAEAFFQSFVTKPNGEFVIIGSDYLCTVLVNGQCEVKALSRQNLVAMGVIEGDEEEEFLTVPSTVPSDLAEKWTDGETRFMLDKYNEYLSQIGPYKKFRLKKNMWEKIAEDIMSIGSTKDASQCENRYKTLLKRKKGVVDGNRTTGNVRKTVPFEEELNKLASLDDSVEPEVRRGVGVVQRKEPSPSEKENRLLPGTSSEDETPVKKRKTKDDPLLQYLKEKQGDARKKEELKQQRHKERLDFIRSLFGK